MDRESAFTHAALKLLPGGMADGTARTTFLTDMPAMPAHPTTNKLAIWAAAVLGMAAIGTIDFFSGVELRVYPLYFAPISYIAWQIGRSGAFIAAALSAS